MFKASIRIVAVLAGVLGITLLAINLYGLSQPIRMPGLGVEEQELLRFVPERVWSYEESIAAIDSLGVIENPDELALKANHIVNQSLVHIEWKQVDPKKYRQLVPVWENYFLYTVGLLSGLEQFQRYHYSDYKRNIERGIGVCGDASTVLSSVLDKYGIDNRIVSFEGHVIVEYLSESGKYILLDPDFGVPLDIELSELKDRPFSIKRKYLAAGYSSDEVDALMRLYLFRDYKIFDDAYEFMKKRYVFEKVSYIMKWILPIVLILVSSLVFRSSSKAGDANA